MIPAGVHAEKPDSSSWASFPRLSGLKPSTSFSGAIRRKIACSSSPFGSGDWTRMPSIAGSVFRASTRVSSSSWRIETGGRRTRLSIPISAAVWPFFFTYETEAGSSPTRTSAMQGFRPTIAETSAFSSAMISAAILLPSIASIYFRRRPSASTTRSLLPSIGFREPRTTTGWPE